MKRIIYKYYNSKYSEYYSQEKYDYVYNCLLNNIPTTTGFRLMCKHYGLEENALVGRKYRLIFNKDIEHNHIEKSEDFIKAKAKIFNSDKKRFIFSWCQSETEINENFLTNIEAYADYIDADIHIIAGRYKNPISLHASKKQEKRDKNKNFWHQRVTPYLDANRQNMHEYLCVLGDIKIQPTASNPLSGLNSITDLESCILGHPRVHFKSLPVLDNYPNKLLLTTGAVSVPNYTDTKVGAKGNFHHTYGFVVLELDNDIFHIRQVQSDKTGAFYDLDLHVKNGVVEKYTGKYPAMVFGDVHLGSHDKVSLNKSLEIARKFKTDLVVIHDIFDGATVNHHEINNPFAQLRNELKKDFNLETEIKNVVKFFKKHDDLDFLVISSNHDDFLDRWLKNTDWRKNPNRMAYLKYANIVAQNKAPNGVIPYILQKKTKNVKCLGLNNSYRLNGWELSQHGHIGVNGSRGSVSQFKNLNTKTITGHSHTPAREDGSVVVGTLTNKRLGYNNGASSWMHSNVLMYPNGKVSHINLINGKYTTL